MQLGICYRLLWLEAYQFQTEIYAAPSLSVVRSGSMRINIM